MKRVTGRYERIVVSGEEVASFVPSPLPPRDPVLDIGGEVDARLRAAEQALARLEIAGETIIPSIGWFLYAFVRKEAVITSQIEGTQATLVDLLAFEAAPGAAPGVDVEEVSNYIAALDHARAEIARPGAPPLSMRLLNDTHRRLMSGVRGANKMPGEIRRSQNWIGGSRPGNAVFVPPPAHMLPALLSALESWLHADSDLPPLTRAGLAHGQFETIHPYLDGNGRIGRLLIGLLLEHWGLLKAPLLYLSLFFKRRRHEYYARLNGIRADGDWEGWIGFFLEGVAAIADEAVTTARDIFRAVTEDRARVLARDTATAAAARLFETLPMHPVLSVATAAELLGASRPTAARAIRTLVEAGVLVETADSPRNRIYDYRNYIDLLRVGTELDDDGAPAAAFNTA